MATGRLKALQAFLTDTLLDWKKLEKILIAVIVLVSILLLSRFLFIIGLLVVAFLYKYICCRTFLDYTGFDPFFFLTFYAGYVHGVLPGFIFGLLFGIAYVLAQEDFEFKYLTFGSVCIVVGVFSAFLSPLSALTAGIIAVGIGVVLDIGITIFFDGFDLWLVLWHSGHALTAYLLLTKVLQVMPGIV